MILGCKLGVAKREGLKCSSSRRATPGSSGCKRERDSTTPAAAIDMEWILTEPRVAELPLLFAITQPYFLFCNFWCQGDFNNTVTGNQYQSPTSITY